MSDGFRASGAEREHAVELLRRAASEGRLTVEELDERAQTAYRVQTRAELEGLIADVSHGSIVPAGTGRAVVPRGEHHGRQRRRSQRCRAVGVEGSQLALMGGNDIRLGDARPAAAAPVIRLRLVSIMGGVRVRRGRKRLVSSGSGARASA